MAGSRRRMVALVGTALGLVLGLATPPAQAGIEPHIIGGDPAGTGEYPFMAAILDDTVGGTDYNRQFCGGSLIDGDWVLTAAHCVEGESAADLAVAVGRTVLSSNQGQRRDVVAVHVHPSFGSPTSLSHDVALLRLASNVTGIAPITVATSTHNGFEAAGTTLRVIGWGSTTASGRPNYPDELREVDVPAVSDTQCGRTYGSSFHASSMLCAGAPGVDSCYGDSGGPLIVGSGSTYIQMGTVSWGNGCAKKRFPGVYGEANNAAIRSWITSLAGV